MIEFKGEISKPSEKILLKKQLQWNFIGVLLFLILSVPMVIVYALYTELLNLIFLFIPIIISICLMLSPLYSVNPPKHIIIENESINIMCEKSANVRRIDSIKKIIDYGNCYFVIFRFPHNYFSCLCQKDLLSNGTLEKFEELFQNYIIKKDFK